MIRRLRVGVVAGEVSGDRLGAALIRALRARVPELEVLGVAGEGMRAAGCRSIADIDALSVMGVTEIFTHLPQLLKLRRRIVRVLTEFCPDIVVGVDAPDFNLGMERRLRRRGVRTVHYVSPSVWAWRPGRVHVVARAARAVLCLLPFEPAWYSKVDVHAEFVGHPLADEIAPMAAEAARRAIGLAGATPILAVLPGSRLSEVRRLAPLFLAAAARVAEGRTGLQVVVPLARTALEEPIRRAFAAFPAVRVTVLHGQSRLAMAAADAVLAASGTATLEALLLDRPMVVAYRLQPLTAWLLRRAGVKTPFFSLPNLLAGEALVPELIQEEASVARITAAVEELFSDDEARRRQRIGFAKVRGLLGRGAAARAADALLGLAGFSGA